MNRVLVVSPHFPPASTADSQRVRTSLRHYSEHGWQPTVLAVESGIKRDDASLSFEDEIPHDIEVHRVASLPERVTRLAGIGDIGLRAWPMLARAGGRILAAARYDLVFFSTTVFNTMPLGRIWKERHGVPFILDFQDPWWSEYYEQNPGVRKPRKHFASSRLHRTLEGWTMAAADGIMSVSTAYVDLLRSRYARLADVPSAVIPFGASRAEIARISTAASQSAVPRDHDDIVNCVYVGRGGDDMAPALRRLFGAVRRGLDTDSTLFGRLRMRFIGTSYAPRGKAVKTVEPIAAEYGLAGIVLEQTERIPYVEAVASLAQADLLVVPGSNDPQYTASKFITCVLTRKPILAIFASESDICDFIASTQSAELVRMSGSTDQDVLAVHDRLRHMLGRVPYEPDVRWQAVEPYVAESLTGDQCRLFDAVVRNAAA